MSYRIEISPLARQEIRALPAYVRAQARQLIDELSRNPRLLTRPTITLSKPEEREVKRVAQELLQALKAERLVLDWRKQQQARAAVKLAIEDALDRGLPPAYSPDIFKQKCEAVYLHVYDSYYGAGRSLYALAG